MSMIQVENLTYRYPGSSEAVFENLSFQLDSRWKLGLIGRNGRGKTTLMRLLTGECDAGCAIHTAVQFEYFPRTVSDPQRPAMEALREICPAAEEWELVCELSKLGLEGDVLEQPFSTLSGGEQTRSLLAAMFLNEGRFLLIDEPTNHLDAAGRARMADYLRRKRGFILASHDRALLDGCVDHILSINRTGIEVQAGNYSSWQLNFDRQQAFEQARDAQLRRDIGRMREAARQSADWSDRVEATKGVRVAGLKPDKGRIGHKAAKLMQRSKSIEARREQAIEEKAALLKNAEKSEPLKLSPLSYHAQRLLELRDVRIHYDGREICGPLTLELALMQGERVCLEGRNGSGKSSLLRLILGEDVPHEGRIQLASGLIVSYVAQSAAQLWGSLSDFARERGVDGTLLRTILRKLGFERAQFERDMAEFSQGQRKKALIAASLCQRAQLYLWDEPLNYIDIDSRIQIEALLREAQPTMLFVEHDAAFQRAVATRTLRL